MTFPKQHFDKLKVNGKRNEPFKPTQPHFSNPVSKQLVKATFAKGKSDVKEKESLINLGSFLNKKFGMLMKAT